MYYYQSKYSPPPGIDPWKRLVAKIVERAVLDLCFPGGRKPWELDTAIAFLTDEGVRSLCDAWGLWLPWSKIHHLARQENGRCR
jgi:hypothetical protein